MEFTFNSSSTYILITALAILLIFLAIDAFIRRRKQQIESNVLVEAVIDTNTLSEAPGPFAWPIIGSLHLLGGYEVPYAAFSKLAECYGDIVKLYLGQQKCIVVNGLNNIKEVLINKGADFDGRPNFARFHQLFCGDKENSLAFCDWSDVQKLRREMLRNHTFPRAFSSRFNQLDVFLEVEVTDLIARIDSSNEQPLAIKPEILHACANVFTSYFCSKRFDRNNIAFNQLITNFDTIFYEVNQGYAADFLPWLLPFHNRHLAEMSGWSHDIRQFMVDHIIEERKELNKSGVVDEHGDYISALLEHLEGDAPKLSFEAALFALEDIVGGHSAVGNLIVKTLGFIATRPNVQAIIKEEADSLTLNGTRALSLSDRTAMPYTDAVTLEAIRLISSPIVPHVANTDSSVAGFKVEKDTLIFLNNYELNMSEKLWSKPKEFLPERFLQNGRLVKPEHFLPFGGGRRSCMGYKMVQFTCFAIIGSIIQKYKIEPVEKYHVPIGDLALPADTFKFKFIPH